MVTKIIRRYGKSISHAMWKAQMHKHEVGHDQKMCTMTFNKVNYRVVITLHNEPHVVEPKIANTLV